MRLKRIDLYTKPSHSHMKFINGQYFSNILLWDIDPLGFDVIDFFKMISLFHAIILEFSTPTFFYENLLNCNESKNPIESKISYYLLLLKKHSLYEKWIKNENGYCCILKPKGLHIIQHNPYIPLLYTPDFYSFRRIITQPYFDWYRFGQIIFLFDKEKKPPMISYHNMIKSLMKYKIDASIFDRSLKGVITPGQDGDYLEFHTSHKDILEMFQVRISEICREHSIDLIIKGDF